MDRLHDADSALPESQDVGHGARCDCLLLAAATHGGPGAVTFSFCRHVLQKRYTMTCRHGERRPVAPVKTASEKWHGFGEIDAAKAILLTNS